MSWCEGSNHNNHSDILNRWHSHVYHQIQQHTTMIIVTSTLTGHVPINAKQNCRTHKTKDCHTYFQPCDMLRKCLTYITHVTIIRLTAGRPKPMTQNDRLNRNDPYHRASGNKWKVTQRQLIHYWSDMTNLLYHITLCPVIHTYCNCVWKNTIVRMHNVYYVALKGFF